MADILQLHNILFLALHDSLVLLFQLSHLVVELLFFKKTISCIPHVGFLQLFFLELLPHFQLRFVFAFFGLVLDMAGTLDLVENVHFEMEFFLKYLNLLIQGFLLLVKHLQKRLMLKFILDIGSLNDICSGFDVNIEGCLAVPFILELDVVVVLLMQTVGHQHLDDFDQKLPDIIDQFMRLLQMFLKYHSTTFDDLVVEDQVTFDRVIGHEIPAFLQMVNIIVMVVNYGLRVDVGDDGADEVVLFEDGRDGALDLLIALDELTFFLEDVGSELADVFVFGLEVHELKGSDVLQVANGFGQPAWWYSYILWKSTREINRLGCCPWSFRHFGQPILKECTQVLCRHTNMHFSL